MPKKNTQHERDLPEKDRILRYRVEIRELKTGTVRALPLVGMVRVWRCFLCFLAVNGLWAVMRWFLPPGPTGTSPFEPVPDRFQPSRNGQFTAHSRVFIEDLGLRKSGLLEARVGIEPA